VDRGEWAYWHVVRQHSGPLAEVFDLAHSPTVDLGTAVAIGQDVPLPALPRYLVPLTGR
jgi:hypothetical protein